MCRTAFLNKYYLLFILWLSCNGKKEALPFYNTPDFTPLFIEDTEKVDELVPHRISDFSFKNQNGETISQSDIEGKIHVANFFFTSCGSICPAMTQNLKKVSDYFKNDSNIVFLSYSVTPRIDSVPRLKAYQEKNGITNTHWYFLTGEQSKIYHLARTSYFAEEDLGYTKDSTDFLHTEHILLIDKTKRIRGIYNGTLKTDMENLIQDINLLEEE